MTTKADALKHARSLNLPRADAKSLNIKITATANLEEAEAEAAALNDAIARYAAAFAHTDDHTCPGCGTRLTGLLGSFTWGLVHGEGHCRSCGYPCRAYHRPKDDNGEAIFESALQAILPYHPDDLEVRSDNS